MANAACILQIVQKEQDYSHYLLLVEIVEYLNCSLDYHKVEIFKAL